MILTYRNVESSKYNFFNIIYAYILIKLNCTFNFSLHKNKIMSLTFMIFIVICLQSWIYDYFVYYLIIEYKMKILQSQKIFIYMVFFLSYMAITVFYNF